MLLSYWRCKFDCGVVCVRSGVGKTTPNKISKECFEKCLELFRLPQWIAHFERYGIPIKRMESIEINPGSKAALFACLANETGDNDDKVPRGVAVFKMDEFNTLLTNLFNGNAEELSELNEVCVCYAPVLC